MLAILLSTIMLKLHMCCILLKRGGVGVGCGVCVCVYVCVVGGWGWGGQLECQISTAEEIISMV